MTPHISHPTSPTSAGEHEEAILADLKRLDITPSSVSHTSDHFEAILKIQTQMIADGAMGRVSDLSLIHI